MGWGVGEDDCNTRWRGYQVPCKCEHPECGKDIDRGVAHRCGGTYADWTCGLFFCGGHLQAIEVEDEVLDVCEQCAKRDPKDGWDDSIESFAPKADAEEWIRWVLTHESWGDWRVSLGLSRVIDEGSGVDNLWNFFKASGAISIDEMMEKLPRLGLPEQGAYKLLLKDGREVVLTFLEPYEDGELIARPYQNEEGQILVDYFSDLSKFCVSATKIEEDEIEQ